MSKAVSCTDWLHFDDTPVGYTSPILAAVFYNEGDESVTVTSVTALAPFALDVTAPSFPQVVLAGHELVIPVVFSPVATGDFSDSSGLVYASDGDTPVLYTILTGRGIDIPVSFRHLTAVPSVVNFPTTATGADSAEVEVVLSNDGTAPTTVATVTITLPFLAGTGNPTPPFVVPVNGSQTIRVKFHPTVATTDDDADGLHIHSDAETDPVDVRLVGTGVVTPIVTLAGDDVSGLFAFGAAVKLCDPDDFNCEEVAKISRVYHFGEPWIEKTLKDVFLHYEDLGAGTLIISTLTLNANVTKTITYGVTANEAIRLLQSEHIIEGDVVYIQFYKPPSTGGLSIIDLAFRYAPEETLLGVYSRPKDRKSVV